MIATRNKIRSTTDDPLAARYEPGLISKRRQQEELDANPTENDSGVLAMLSLLSESSNEGKEIRPQLKTGYEGIIYDLGAGFEVAYEKLRQFERKGLLSSSGFLAFSTCPKCEDLNLRTLLFCPECSSQSLLKSELLIHYDCQSTGPIEEFQSSIRNGYYCQKCRKELKRVGIDYGNPGIGFKCSSCDKVFQFPLVLSQCSSFHTSKIDELSLRSFPKYMLSSNAKGLSPLLIESRNLKTALEKRKIQSKILPTLNGASGANHVVPLLLTIPSAISGADADQKIAVEFINDDSNAEKSVLQLLLKSADLDKIRMIIISKGAPGSLDHIKAIVNPQKVKVLPATDDSGQLPEQIVKEVTTW